MGGGEGVIKITFQYLFEDFVSQNYVLILQPIVTAEVGSIPSPSQFRNMATTYRLEDYMRFLERRSNNFNRGASQETIERFTFPHKYKRVSKLFSLRSQVARANRMFYSIIRRDSIRSRTMTVVSFFIILVSQSNSALYNFRFTIGKTILIDYSSSY